VSEAISGLFRPLRGGFALALLLAMLIVDIARIYVIEHYLLFSNFFTACDMRLAIGDKMDPVRPVMVNGIHAGMREIRGNILVNAKRGLTG